MATVSFLLFQKYQCTLTVYLIDDDSLFARAKVTIVVKEESIRAKIKGTSDFYVIPILFTCFVNA